VVAGATPDHEGVAGATPDQEGVVGGTPDQEGVAGGTPEESLVEMYLQSSTFSFVLVFARCIYHLCKFTA